VAATPTAWAATAPPEPAQSQLVTTMDESPRAGLGRVALAARVDRRQRPAVASVTARPSVAAGSDRPAEDMAARVAALLAARPTVTAEEVAQAIGRAPRTARRYLAAARAAMAAPVTVAATA
jgi:hypothetical protein